MTRAELIQYITDNVYPNARNEVTAPMVRDSLLEIVDFLGDAATYNIGMVASGNQGLVTGGNVNTAIALALLPYYTAVETGQAIDDAIARIGLGQAAYKNIGQVAENNTDLVTGGQVYTAINTALTSAIKFQGISDTPLTDGSTTNPIQINGQSYTAKKGDMVVYGGNEFLWVGNKWQQMGDESSYALKTVQITGTGYLTGGGDLTQSRTLDISATAKGYIDHGEAAYNYFPGGVLDSTHLPSMYIGTTSVQFTAAAQNLTGISSVRATSNVLTLFEWDVTNSAWHFHGNIYTDGWFSGGGISPGGGGGGGGIDPVAMWRLLTNDPSLTQYDDYTKISADHINFPVMSVVGLGGNVTAQQIAQALNLGSFAYKNSLSTSDIPDLSGMYLPLTGGTLHANDFPLTLKTDASGAWCGIHFVGITSQSLGYLVLHNDVADAGPFYITPGQATAYRIWHEGNSNKNNVPWSCSNLYATSISEGGVLLANKYLALSGGTMANTNVVTNLNADLLDGFHNGELTARGISAQRLTQADNLDDISPCFFSYNDANDPTSHIGENAAGIQMQARLWDRFQLVFPGNNDGTIQYRNSYYVSDSTWAWSGWKQIAFTTSNVASATQLANARTIWGQSFDGTANVTGAQSNVTNIDSLLYFDDTNSRVGLKTASPAYPFDVVGDLCINRNDHSPNNTTFRINCADNSVNLYSVDNDDNSVNLRFYLSGVERFTILNNGKVGIGKPTPDFALDVNGAVVWSRAEVLGPASNWNLLNLCGLFAHQNYDRPANSKGFNEMIFSCYQSDRGDIWQFGCGANEDVMFWRRGYYNSSFTSWRVIYDEHNANNNSTPWACSDLNASNVIYAVTGIYTDGWFSGGGVASSSDRRLKKNIKNFAYTPKLLLAIRPREWDWKDGSAMVGHAAGFVAQEIEPIMPYAVDGTRNFKALFYDRFHALEIAGLQDHERRIVELERAVKERDKKIAKLEKMLKLN